MDGVCVITKLSLLHISLSLTIFLLLAQHSEALNNPTCPGYEGGTCNALNFPSQITSKHYYLHVLSRTNWWKAHQFCLMHGMRLATIFNEEQNNELMALLKANDVTDVWIGITELGSEGRWYNMKNGSFLSYTNWTAGNPSGKVNLVESGLVPASCGRFWKNENNVMGWDDDICWFDRYFACDLV